MSFSHLHDRHEGDWQGFEPRFYQDFTNISSRITQSGFSELDYTKSYLLRWSDWQTTESGYGGIRVNFFDNTYNEISGAEYVDIPFKLEQAYNWRRNIVRFKPFKDEVGLSDYEIPSGTRYAKIEIIMPEVTGVVTERFVSQLDLVEGNHYVGYTSFSGDTTFVSYKGLNNGYYPGNPLMRETYEFMGQRLWKSEDASSEVITYEDTSAANNTEYSYVVDAFDLNGNRSPLSDKKTIMAGDVYPPAQVSGLIAVAGPESIILIWEAPSDSDYSHVNIYADGSFATLVKPEFGSPSAKDTTIIGGLTPGVEHIYYLCSVDVYGNENRVNVPTATGTPTAFSNTEDLLITLDGDDYLKLGTETFLVWSRLQLDAVPTVSGWDSANNPITIGTITELEAGILYSGSLTIGAGTAEGQARLLASGITQGSIALSPFKTFVVDKTAPAISLSLLDFNYDDGKKFYNKNSMGKFSVLITDDGGPKAYIHRLNASINAETTEYINDIVNGKSVLLPVEGLNTIYVKGRDIAGNESNEVSIVAYRDSEAPIVSISGVGSNSQYGLWSNSTTNIAVKFLAKDNEVVGASDVSGFYRLYWRYAYNRAPDTGDTWNFASTTNPTVTVPPTGSIPASTASIQIEYYGVDNAGNASEHVIETLNVDNVAPVFTAGLWGNCQPVPGGFSLVWDPTKITDAAPSSGLKQIRIYRDTNSAMTTKVGVATIGFNVNGTRSFVDSANVENYKTYWWAMEAEDNAGNVSALSTTVSGQIGHNITGIFRNFISNGSFERVENYDLNLPTSWWKTGSPTIEKTATPSHGTNFAIVDNTNYYYIQNIPLINNNANKRWVFSCDVKKSASSTLLSGHVTFKYYNANKELIQTNTKTLGPLSNSAWTNFDIPMGNSAHLLGYWNPPTAALSYDIILSGSQASTTGSVYFDAVQLELPSINTTATGTNYVDSYNITGDIIQGQRIIGSQIEANTINTEHLTVGIHGGNALSNASFEMTKYDTTEAAGYLLTGGAVVSQESSFDGTRSIKFPLSATPSIKHLSYIKIDQDTNYCASFHCRTNTASTADISLYMFQLDSSQQYILNGSTPHMLSGTFAINNTEWDREYLAIGPGTAYTVQPTCAFVELYIKKTSGEITYIDAIQFEQGSEPTLYSDGGLTQIDGGTIKTGRITGTTLESPYFDLNSGEIRTYENGSFGTNRYTQITGGKLYTRDNNGDFTDIIAGRMSTLNAALGKRTDIIAGEILNTNVVNNNYSRLTEGLLEFYNATAGTTTNYAVQVDYIDPSQITMSILKQFNYEYYGPQPIVIPQPVFFQSYSTANAASNQYCGYELRQVGNTGFYIDGYLYNGVPTSSGFVGAQITDRTLSLATNSDVYTTADAKDDGHCTTDVNQIKIVVKARNPVVQAAVANGVTARIGAGNVWPASPSSPTILASHSTTLTTVKNSTAWMYYSFNFSNLTPGNKCVKVDWHTKSGPETVEMEVESVTYISRIITASLTGTGKCGALVIGRTV